MIELVVKDFLEQHLPVSVYMEYPEDAPDRFVVLKKGDTGRENYVDTAMFVADSYAESLFEAAKLNAQVIAVMDSLADLDAVCSSRRGGDYPFPDIQNKRYRYQAVQNITHY